MRTIAVTNQKGGCGKTTTAINLAAAFAKLGYRTLLVDFDPQSHATLGVGFNPNAFDRTIYEVLTCPSTDIGVAIVPTKVNGLHLLPSNVSLSAAEHDLMTMLGKEMVLAAQLRRVEDRYDFCVVDCAPSVGILAINALVASTEVLVPVQVHFYAIQGLQRLLETVRILNKRFNPCTVEMLGLLLTFVDDRTLLTKRVKKGMRQYFGDLVFDTTIHATVSLAEAPGAGRPILQHAPESRGALEYRALAEEAIKRIGMTAQTRTA